MKAAICPRQMRVRNGAACLFAMTLATGCAHLPPERVLPSVAPMDSFASSASLSAPEAGWPADRWWKGFGDQQLDVLIEEALVGASDVRVAEARLLRAQAVVGVSRSRSWPSLDANAEAGATKQSYNYLFPEALAPQGWPDYGLMSLRLNWEIDFWGRNRAALAAARSDAEAARAEEAAARLLISATVASTYADLAGLYAEYDAAVRATEVRWQTLNLMTQRQENGLENTGSVERARSALATARGNLAELTEALALTRNRIAELVGAGPDRGLAIARPNVVLSDRFGLPANLPAELLGRRPDIMAARLRVEASGSRIKVAKADFYPNINLAGLVGLQALGVDDVFKSGSEFGTVGPALSLPIFDGGRLRGRYRAAESDYRTAVAQYDGALTQALREVADAVTSERALAERLGRAAEAERAANAAWTVANNRYKGGLATYLDVLTAEDALIEAMRRMATLRTRSFALDIALIQALGGGYQS